MAAETVTFLLRNIEFAGYAASAGKLFNDLDEAEQKFQQVRTACICLLHKRVHA